MGHLEHCLNTNKGGGAQGVVAAVSLCSGLETEVGAVLHCACAHPAPTLQAPRASNVTAGRVQVAGAAPTG